MRKKGDNLSIGNGIITSLKQAIEFEKGKKVPGVKSNKISMHLYPIILPIL